MRRDEGRILTSYNRLGRNDLKHFMVMVYMVVNVLDIMGYICAQQGMEPDPKPCLRRERNADWERKPNLASGLSNSAVKAVEYHIECLIFCHRCEMFV